MKNIVHFALAALCFAGIASAQNLPPIDVFGGYSYLSFDLPANAATVPTSQRLGMNGWNVSASVAVFRRFAAEADFGGHQLGDCTGVSGLTCKNFSYMFGPRFLFGDHSKKLTGFVHAVAGQDRMDLNVSGVSTTDTSVSAAAGGGVDYWFMKHIGVQLGPVDYVYTSHLHNDDVSGQNSYRVSAGVVFRFGGNFAEKEPSPKPKPDTSSSAPAPRPRRARGQAPAAAPEAAPSQPAQPLGLPGRGMSIASLGVVVAPQEFDGAKILQVVPGGVAEMASLKAGDLIRSVDGKAVRTPMELAAELSDKTGKVRIGILRGDFATETMIVLGIR